MRSAVRRVMGLCLLGGLANRPLAAAEEPPPLPVLYGVMGREATKRAWLGATLGESRWQAEGDRVGAYLIQSIAVEEGRVTLLGPEQTVVHLSLSGMGGDALPTLIPAEELDWAWIRSDDNPMRHQPENISESMINDWVHGHPSARVTIRNHYRRMGWDVTHIEIKDAGRIIAGISPLRNPAEPQPTREEIRDRQASAGSILPEE